MKTLSRLIFTAIGGLVAIILFALICGLGWLCASVFAFARWLPQPHLEGRVPREKQRISEPAMDLPVLWASRETSFNGMQPQAGDFVSLRSCPTRFATNRPESSRQAASRRLKRRVKGARCGLANRSSRFSTDPAKSWARVHRF